MKKMIFLLALFIGAISYGKPPDPDSLLRQLDRNLIAESKVVTSKMIVHGRRGSRTLLAKTWMLRSDTAYTEYLAPPREKGTKMLKLGNQLWIYSPQTDRIIRIAGHMLRQSVMGSDLSYEDLMEEPELHRSYRAQIAGADTLDGHACWILQLTARKPGINYYSRKIWVDRQKPIIWREERYARSGKLLKTTRITEIMRVGHRWLPRHIIFKDVLKRGKGTEFIVDAVQLNVKIPPYLFSKAALRK